MCAAESSHGEEEADGQRRSRLDVGDALLHPLQSGLRSSGRPQTRRESVRLLPSEPIQPRGRGVRRRLMLHIFLQDNTDPVLLGDHDVALASIEKVVVGETFSFILMVYSETANKVGGKNIKM